MLKVWRKVFCWNESEKIDIVKKSLSFSFVQFSHSFHFFCFCVWIQCLFFIHFSRDFWLLDEHYPYFISHNVCNESIKFIHFYSTFVQLNKSFVKMWRWIMIKQILFLILISIEMRVFLQTSRRFSFPFKTIQF